jgi:hypothetical protein
MYASLYLHHESVISLTMRMVTYTVLLAGTMASVNGPGPFVSFAANIIGKHRIANLLAVHFLSCNRIVVAGVTI